MAHPHSDCTCLFKALGFHYESEYYELTRAQVLQAFRKTSLSCHPDKNPAAMKELTNLAQQLITQARNILADERQEFNYLNDGEPPECFSHSCTDMKQAIDFITEKLTPPPPQPEDPSTQPSSPPPNTSASASSENGEQQPSSNWHDPFEDSDPESFWDESNSKSTDSERKKRGRRRSVFNTTGYQHMVGKITDNKHRTQGAMYKMDWKAKPGYSTWLSEEDIIKYCPDEAKEYLENL